MRFPNRAAKGVADGDENAPATSPGALWPPIVLKADRNQRDATVGDTASRVEGMSLVNNPLLLDAILHGWANA